MSEVLELGKRRAEALGIGWYACRGPSSHIYYNADDIHQLLGAGEEVFRMKRSAISWHNNKITSDDHQALLIGIKPIVHESPERQLLRKIVTDIGNVQNWYGARFTEHFEKRLNEAKALLESEGEK